MTNQGTGRSPMFGRTASTPYAGGTGSTGSDASHDRREHEDESGISALRQEQVLGALRQAGSTGLTWSELGDKMEPKWHHGQATGALSVLHKDGEIEALTDRRKRSTVYVLKEFVLGRPTRDPGSTKGNRRLQDANVALERENAVLNQRVIDLQATVAERDRTLAEVNGELDSVRNRLGQETALRRQVEQGLALGVEQATRLDEERARLERLLSLARADAAAADEERGRVEQINYALRTRHALAQLEPDEQALHERIGAKLASAGIAEADDGTPIRVTLGVLRTLWAASGRLIPDALPQRTRPGLEPGEGISQPVGQVEAPAGPAPAPAPEQ